MSAVTKCNICEARRPEVQVVVDAKALAENAESFGTDGAFLDLDMEEGDVLDLCSNCALMWVILHMDPKDVKKRVAAF